MENPIVDPLAAGRTLQELRRALLGLMEVESVKILTAGPRPAVEFAGRVRDLGEDATFDEILQRFAALGYTPLLSLKDNVHILQAIPEVADKRTGKPWVNLVLFVLTLLSVLYTGALNAGESPGDSLSLGEFLIRGLPFAGTLLAILTAHELSHYFVGRRYGSPISLPYFIPLPTSMSILGTMGAVIVQKGPMRSRKALFDIGAAGPLGGLLVALPLLVVGLCLSNVEPLPVGQSYIMEGNSLFYYALKWVIFGRPLPAGGMDVMLHPMAFAAWAGLMVTALNLFPVGQFDGGHITYALWGRKAWTVARLFVYLMFGWGLILSLLGNGAAWTWIIWGFLGTLMGTRHPAPLNDVTPLDKKRQVLGWIVVALFVLLLIPIPLVIVQP